jgi:alpha-tubulin suppressor-like RCC1 family protein
VKRSICDVAPRVSCFIDSKRGCSAVVGVVTSLLAFAISPAAYAVKYSQISASSRHTCAIISGGQVQCWGENSFGQLGNGRKQDASNVPVAVSGIDGSTINGVIYKAKAVSAGRDSTCAILVGGQAMCWGRNHRGQLGDGSLIDSTVPIKVLTLNNASTISVGDDFACATLTTFQARCWGEGTLGQLGNGANADESTPQAVQTSSGTLTNVTGISAGNAHVCAVTTASNVFCWGAGTAGQLGNGLGANSNTAFNVGLASGVAVGTGRNFSCALTPGGRVRCWGENGSGQLGNNSTTDAASPVIVQRQSGAIVELSDVSALSVGYAHACVLRGAEAPHCWGINTSRQLGDNTTVARSVATEATAIIGTPAAITAGTNHTCAVFPSGNAQCWGFGDNGELGDGNNTRTGIPRWVIETTCTLDLDGDGNVSALSDGVMIVRALLGFGGLAVTNGAAGGGVPRPTWAEIRPLLSTNCGLQGLAP